MTLTLEIPDDLAPRLAAMPEKDRQSYTLAALRLAAVYGPTREPDPVFTPEQLASIGRGLEQLDAGEGIDGDLVMAELFESVGLPPPVPFNKPCKTKNMLRLTKTSARTYGTSGYPPRNAPF